VETVVTEGEVKDFLFGPKMKVLRSWAENALVLSPQILISIGERLSKSDVHPTLAISAEKIPHKLTMPVSPIVPNLGLLSTAEKGPNPNSNRRSTFMAKIRAALFHAEVAETRNPPILLLPADPSSRIGVSSWSMAFWDWLCEHERGKIGSACNFLWWRMKTSFGLHSPCFYPPKSIFRSLSFVSFRLYLLLFCFGFLEVYVLKKQPFGE